MSRSTSTYEPLDPTKALVVLVDCQIRYVTGIEKATFENSTMAHVGLSAASNMPTIVTTLAEAGPLIRSLRIIQNLGLESAAFIQRSEEMNPWDNSAFKNAVTSSGKTQFILAGPSMDLSVTPLALSLLAAGYKVAIHADACGASSKTSVEDAKDRMRIAGAAVMSTVGIASEIFGGGSKSGGADKGPNSKPAGELFSFLRQYLPEYEYLCASYDAATNKGSTQPGQTQ